MKRGKAPQQVVQFLNDAYEKLNPHLLVTEIKSCFPPSRAKDLVNDFYDNVVVPLGEMKEIAELLQDYRAQPSSYAEKIQQEREQQSLPDLAERAKKLLDTRVLQEISGHAERFLNIVGMRIRAIDNKISHTTQAGKMYRLTTQKERLEDVGSNLRGFCALIDIFGARFNTECPAQGITELIETAEKIGINDQFSSRTGKI